ncbi:MAG TPA: hypothetical protein VE781_17230 [Kineosporiaceae bacterium]|nr:hypothetical protein [Kineosporiaceae bacterium]
MRATDGPPRVTAGVPAYLARAGLLFLPHPQRSPTANERTTAPLAVVDNWLVRADVLD